MTLDERTDATASDAMEHATKPLSDPEFDPLFETEQVVFPKRGTVSAIWADDAGLLRPLTTHIPVDDIARWRKFDAAKLMEIFKATHLQRTVLSCEWVARPQDYRFFERDLGPDVVLVKVAGNVGSPLPVAPSANEKFRRTPKVEQEEHWDAGSVRSYKDRLHGIRGSGVPAPVSVEPGPKCGCGIGHTLGSYRALPLVSASDHQSGDVKIHDEARTCACGETLRLQTKRMVSE